MGMFHHAQNFNQRLLWDARNLETATEMFRNTKKFNCVLYWNMPKLKDASRMFAGAEAIPYGYEINLPPGCKRKKLFT